MSASGNNQKTAQRDTLGRQTPSETIPSPTKMKIKKKPSARTHLLRKTDRKILIPKFLYNLYKRKHPLSTSFPSSHATSRADDGDGSSLHTVWTSWWGFNTGTITACYGLGTATGGTAGANQSHYASDSSIVVSASAPLCSPAPSPLPTSGWIPHLSKSL